MRIFLLTIGYIFFVFASICIFGSIAMVISEPFYHENVSCLIIVLLTEIIVMIIGAILVKRNKKYK